MATPTITATPGAANANSYLTVAEADAYHESHLYSEVWDDADADQKIKALIMATRLLDAFYSWSGSSLTQRQSSRLPAYAYYTWTGDAADGTQGLCWPRTGMVNRNGYDIPETEIPQALKEATAEFAKQLIVSDRTADNDIDVQGITSVKAGSVSLTFKDMIESKVIPDAVQWLLVPSWIVLYENESLQPFFQVL